MELSGSEKSFPEILAERKESKEKLTFPIYYGLESSQFYYLDQASDWDGHGGSQFQEDFKRKIWQSPKDDSRLTEYKEARRQFQKLTKEAGRIKGQGRTLLLEWAQNRFETPDFQAPGLDFKKAEAVKVALQKIKECLDYFRDRIPVVSNDVSFEDFSEKLSREVAKHWQEVSKLSKISPDIGLSLEKQPKVFLVFTPQTPGLHGSADDGGVTIEVNLRDLLRTPERIATVFLHELLHFKMGDPDFIVKFLKKIPEFRYLPEKNLHKLAEIFYEALTYAYSDEFLLPGFLRFQELNIHLRAIAKREKCETLLDLLINLRSKLKPSKNYKEIFKGEREDLRKTLRSMSIGEKTDFYKFIAESYAKLHPDFLEHLTERQEELLMIYQLAQKFYPAIKEYLEKLSEKDSEKVRERLFNIFREFLKESSLYEEQIEEIEEKFLYSAHA